jgi:hypothetical protein
MFLFFFEEISAAFATKDDLPHLLGDIRIVLTEEKKFKTNLSVSDFRSVKFLSEAILPKTNGVSITLFFSKIIIF